MVPALDGGVVVGEDEVEYGGAEPWVVMVVTVAGDRRKAGGAGRA